MAETKNVLTDRYKALSEVALVLNSTLDLDKILKTNLNYAQKLLSADRGTIYLVDKVKQEIWSKVLIGNDIREIRLPFGFGLAGHVAATRETLIIDDVYNDPRFNKDNDARTGYRSKSMLILPMLNNQREIIGVMQLINKIDGLFNEDDREFADSLASLGAVAIETARLHEQSLETAKLRKEMEIARHIQEKLIPKTLPKVDGYDFSIRYEACSEVGGDYVDVIKLTDNNFALIIADVSGHGVPASLLVSTLQASLHAFLDADYPLEKLVGKLNNVVYKNSTADTYITFLIAILNTAKHTLKFCNAGHPAALIIKDNDKVFEMGTSGPPLGMFEEWEYEFSKTTVKEKDFIFFYTDGISETMNAEDEEFGDKDFMPFLLENRRLRNDRFYNKLWTALDFFSGQKPAEDDRTVLSVKRDWII